MKSALIGYTGFVGSNFREQFKFNSLFNSQNIEEIDGKSFDWVVCAAAPGLKWYANKFPQEDLRKIDNLISHLRKISARKFLLVSSVDVYPLPVNVDENTKINQELLSPYGKNRCYLEQFVSQFFSCPIIVRFPGLFGSHLKKNFIFDLINNQNLDLTPALNQFQFYNLKNLKKDVKKVLKNSWPLVNFATEPVKAYEVAEYCLSRKITTPGKAVLYDVHTIYSSSHYFYHKKEVLKDLKKFIMENRK